MNGARTTSRPGAVERRLPPEPASVSEARHLVRDLVEQSDRPDLAESGALLVCPADAGPDEPGDVRPRDLDVAIAIDRLERATTLSVRRVAHSWAGLRTSAPDDLPVVGPDPRVPGFHWLAGLGGYGVQLSPAVGRLLAMAVLNRGAPTKLPHEAAKVLSPGRFALDRT